MPTQQYNETVVFNLAQIKQATQAQNALIRFGFDIKDYTQLVQGLITVPSTIISLMFMLSPGTTFAAGLIAAVAGMLPSEVSSLEYMAGNGLSQLVDVQNLLTNTNYDLVEVRLPFLEYQYADSSKNWRFVDGYGKITRLHTPSGWITA